MAKRYRYPLALLPLLLTGGCADNAPPTAGTSLAAGGSPTATLGASAATASTPLPDSSFTPLPSPEQVKRAQPIGQLDPFRPLSQEIRDLVVKPKASSRPVALPSFIPTRPEPLQPPPGLQLTGLIGAAGRPEAVISYLGANGTVRVGDVGSASGTAGPNATNLLPEGWRVAAIDLNRGSLVLKFKGQTTKKQI
jgi:hypothetical protein